MRVTDIMELMPPLEGNVEGYIAAAEAQGQASLALGLQRCLVPRPLDWTDKAALAEIAKT